MVHTIIVLAVFGFIAGLILKYIPMPDPIRSVIIAIMVLALCVFLLNMVGVNTGIKLGV